MRIIQDKILRCDNKKIIALWSPKSGCATLTQIFFEYINYEYDKDSFIHDIRIKYTADHPSFFPLFENGKFVNPDYKNHIVIQLVRNPYSRVVSSYLVSTTRDSEYYKTIDYPNIISDIPNNLSFIEFLETVKYQINNNANVDIHYDVQTMNHSYVAILQDNILKLENLQKNIFDLNKKYNINLNSTIHYDIHAHNHPLSAYQYYHKKPPEPYHIYYKDSLAKKLVESIYGYDIELFKYFYPY